MPDDALPFIPEESRRWPDFQGGTPILLPDGQEWAFFSPEAVFRAGVPGWTFGPAPPDVDAVLSARFRRLADAWKAATDDAGRASTILAAAWFLLARNYALKVEEFQAIMTRAADWDEAEQVRLGEQLLTHVGLAYNRALSLLEVA